MRTFPTEGLDIHQISRSLKSFGLESILQLCPFNEDNCLDKLKQYLYAYISHNLPILLGGTIYKLDENNKIKECLGKHFVCVLGYKINDYCNSDGNTDSLKLKSKSMEKIYIHDDRYGPFIRTNMELFTGDYENKHVQGLEINIQSSNNELFVPDLLILGLYHKIRIPYENIYLNCNALFKYLKFDIIFNQKILEDDPTKTKVQLNIDLFQKFISCTWSIELTSNDDIKSHLIKTDSFHAYNGVINKSYFLLSNLPKYIWICKLTTSDNKKFTDILFDATEVPQGKLVIGYLSYSEEASLVWEEIGYKVKNREWEKYQESIDSLAPYKNISNISSFIKYFLSESGESYLNTMYGPISHPYRELKPGEFDAYKNITKRNDIYVIANDHDDFTFLEESLRYIWVIDVDGNLILAKDIDDETVDNFEGHPTLINADPARIGGELLYNNTNWTINLKSRAYSSHIRRNSPEHKHYLETVSKFFTTIDVEIAT